MSTTSSLDTCVSEANYRVAVVAKSEGANASITACMLDARHLFASEFN